MKDKIEKLPKYNHLFNRNHYDGRWYCFTRDDINAYFSDRNNKAAKISSGLTQEEAFANWNSKYDI
jgi:hypothetical protein